MNERIKIYLASETDRDDLLWFLGNHWKVDHIFVIRPDIMDWQHRSGPDGSTSNFVLARRGDRGQILGILGFIPLSHFDPGANWSELFLAIWKIRDDARTPGLGLQLLNWLTRHRKPEMIAAIGLSSMVIPIYYALGYTVGELDHYVLLRRSATKFTVADGVAPGLIPPLQTVDPGLRVVRLTAEATTDVDCATLDRLCSCQIPRKSWAYLRNRYLCHPFYCYRLNLILADGEPMIILVWRRVEAGGSAVLRLVDVLGDDKVIARCGAILQQLLGEEEAEYIDIYFHGLSTSALLAAGFVDRRANPGLVIPNYFEPYMRSNVDLSFCYRMSASAPPLPVRLMRGDSDQDRPNQANNH
jgi:hypothetical protein